MNMKQQGLGEAGISSPFRATSDGGLEGLEKIFLGHHSVPHKPEPFSLVREPMQNSFFSPRQGENE